MIGYVYFKENGDAIPTSQAGAIKGGVKIGMLLGQIIFGFLGDTLGRHKIYGRELFFAIFGLLMCTFTPWKGLNGDGLVAWLTVGRLITGLGLGGGKSGHISLKRTVERGTRLMLYQIIQCPLLSP